MQIFKIIIKCAPEPLVLAASFGLAACSGAGLGDSAQATSETQMGLAKADPQRGCNGRGHCVGHGTLLDEPVIELPGETVFPEGSAFSKDGTLYIGSFFGGDVYEVTSKADDLRLLSSGVLNNAAGMVVDGDTLWVCDNYLTTGFSEDAAIVGLDRESGEQTFRHSVGSGPEVCNDLAFDDQGNLYATLSFSNAIVRVSEDLLRSNESATVWNSDPLLGQDFVPGNFGLNGIAFAGDQTLYVASHFTGHLYRIGIFEDGDVARTELVTLKDEAGAPAQLGFPDGLEYEAGALFVAEQQYNWLSRVELATGTLAAVGGGLDNPATLALDGKGSAWVVNSQLNDFAGGTAPTLPFTVAKLALD